MQQKCCTATDTEFCTTANPTYCASVNGGANYASHVMLKIILNNKIFQEFSSIDDNTDTNNLKLKGIDVLRTGGGWMGTAAGQVCDTAGAIASETNTFCLTYTNYQTYMNVIDPTKDYHLFYNHWNTVTEDSGASYYELFWACSSVLSGKDICGAVSETYTANTNVPAVLIRNVKFATTYLGSSLYPNQNEFDMVVCFRYSKEQSRNNGFNVSAQLLASSSLINVATINWHDNGATTKTYLQMGILNYYNPHQNQGTNDVNYIVNLIRFQAKFNSDDLAAGASKLSLFFSDSKALSGGINPTGGLDYKECVMAGNNSAGLTCELKRLIVAASLRSNLEDGTTTFSAYLENPLSMSHIDFTSSSLTTSSSSEINIYVPIVIGTQLIEYAMVGWMLDNNIVKLFKVFGNNEGTYGFAKATKLGGTSLPDAAANQITFASTTEEWKVEGNGCVITEAKYSDATEIKPANSIEEANINSQISGCSSTMQAMNPKTGEANSHFIVHSFKKFWSGNITWGLYSSSATYQTATCAELTISTIRSLATNPYTYYTSYMVVCPYEQSSGAATPLSANVVLKLEDWKFPSNYGVTATLGSHMRLTWTGEDGSVQAYKTQIGTNSATKLTGCTLSEISSVVQNEYFQKTEFTATPDLEITLNSDFPSFKIKLTLGTVGFNVANEKCMVNVTGCSCIVLLSANDLTFTITNVGTSTVTIAKSAGLLFTFYNKYSSSASTTTYTGEIHLYFDSNIRTATYTGTEVTVSSCTSNVDWGTGTTNKYTITMTNPAFSLRAGARGPFSFTFTTDRSYVDIGYLNFNLGFLATETNLATDNKNNLRCALLQNDKISHDFGKFIVSDLTNIQVYFKTFSETDITTISNQVYKFQCHGAKSITQAPSSTAKLEIAYYSTSSTIKIAEVISSDLSGSYTTLRTLNSAETTITLSKQYQYVGQEANYVFNIKPQSGSTTTGVTLFQPGSRIIVELPRAMSPKLNKMGVIECLQESKQIKCEIDYERRVVATISSALDPTNPYGHNFTIVGVDQPASYSSFYSDIFIGLVPADKSDSQFEVMKDGGSLKDETQPTFQTKNIPVLYFKQTGSYLRSSFEFKMDLMLPAGAVKSAVYLYVDFPGEFSEAMFIQTTPRCSLKNVVFGTETVSDFVQQCKFVNSRRIQITSKDDASNTEETHYQLSISNLLTPHYEINRHFVPTVWHGNSSDTQIPLYKTNMGNFNSSYLAFSFEDSKILLTHDYTEKSFVAYIGAYKDSLKLYKSGGEKFYNELEVIKEGQTGYFNIYPGTLEFQQAQESLSLKIAGKQSSAAGRYQIKFIHEQETKYTYFPPVNVILTTGKCLVEPISSTYEVPDGGYSLPILIDFTNCIPISDIEITGNITTDGNASKYFKFAGSLDTKTFTFDEDNIQKYVIFKVSGARDTLSDDEPEYPQGQIDFTFAGTNGASFGISSAISLNIVNGTTDKPEFHLLDVTSDTAGQQRFQFTSTKSGAIYYAFSQNFTALDEIKYATMYTKTEGAGKTITEIDEDIVYGFVNVGNSNNETITVTATGVLEAEAKYKIKAIAIDQMGTLSDYDTKNWTQITNGGKPLMIGFKLESANDTNATLSSNTTLTDTEALNMACTLSNKFGLSKKNVFTSQGKSCYEKEKTFQPSNSSNLRVLFWADRLRRLETNLTSGYEYFIVLPDYYASQGSVKSSVDEVVAQSSFKTDLASEAQIQYEITDVLVIVNESPATVPEVSDPTIKIVQNEAQFTFTMSETNGFMFIGIYESSFVGNITDEQIKGKVNYDFAGYEQVFCFEDKVKTIAISELPLGKYTYSWLATNENIDTLTFTTGVKNGSVFEIVDSAEFAAKLWANLALLLLLLFFLR